MNKSIFVNDTEKLNHFLYKTEITQYNRILEFLEIYNARTDNGLNNGIKVIFSFDIPDDLIIPVPDPVDIIKVRKIRCDKSDYICECCDKNFRDNYALDKHMKTKSHFSKLKEFNRKNQPYDLFAELLGELN